MPSAQYTRAMERLDEVLRAPAKRRAPTKEWLRAKAATIAAEEGLFSAIVSTRDEDREKDIVDPDGMVTALHAWKGVGKMVPLCWNHSGAPEDHVGHILPSSAKNVDGEVHVDGWIDRDAERGKAAWRVIKSGTAGFSFGYLVKSSVDRPDGGRLLTDIDIFEVSVTLTPMNGQTRVTSWKSTDDEAERVPLSLGELQRRQRDIENELGLRDPAVEAFRQATHDAIVRMLNSTIAGEDTNEDKATALRAKADRVAAELEPPAPIRVASFPC